jgi:hypothetical protein
MKYLSYGSNLHITSMKSRCKDAEPVGSVLLNNVRLVFRGVADLQPERGSLAPAGLWEVSERDIERLDAYEGVSVGLYKKCWVSIGDGEKALIYLMSDTGIFPPSAWYVGVIRNGYRNFKLDMSFLDEAIRHSYDQVLPTEQTAARRKRQRRSGYQHRLVSIPEGLALSKEK